MNKQGFTLAEVLITLGIIGIVAAMTLPTLINNGQEKATVSALKQDYSIISQAFIMAQQTFGTPDNWGLLSYDKYSNDDTKNILYYLKPQLKFLTYCGSKNTQCWSDTTTLDKKIFHHSSDVYYTGGVLSNGSSILSHVLSSECTYNLGIFNNVCGTIRIDVNGKKKPNVMGRDTFDFIVTKDKIIPAGLSSISTGDYSFENGCIKSTANGRGCTAWVIFNENMDYLHCDTLSWNGSKKCK